MFMLPKKKPKFDVNFYMRGGHVVTAPGVEKMEMQRSPDGGYSAYTITWADPKNAPDLFTLSISDIVAVVTVKK